MKSIPVRYCQYIIASDYDYLCLLGFRRLIASNVMLGQLMTGIGCPVVELAQSRFILLERVLMSCE